MNYSRRKIKTKRIQLFTTPNTAIKVPNQLHINMNKNFPLGIGYLAAVLEQEGYEVQTVDALVEGWNNVENIAPGKVRIGLSDYDIKNRITAFAPDIVGISSLFTMQTENVIHLARLVKQVDHDITVVVGGANASVLPEVLIQEVNIDFVIMGEGERRLSSLIKVLEKGGDGIENIDGIAYKTNGNMRVIPNTSLIDDIDSLPFPARHLFDMEKYFDASSSHGIRKSKRFTSVITSRGCPMKCTFCTAHKTWGRLYRMRSPENVLKELEYLVTKYNIKEILFEDDNLTMHKGRALKIFEMMIERKLNLEWDTPNGVAVYALDENLLDKMKESGCYHVNFAIESGCQRVLKEVIKKPVNLKRVSELTRYGKSIGLAVGCFLVFGMPGETIEEMKESLRYVRKHRFSNVHIAIASPLPGSVLYELCKEKGYLSEGFTPFKPPNIDYHIQTPEWSKKEIQNFIEKERIKLYIYQQIINPNNILNFLKKGPSYVLRKSFKFAKVLMR